MMGDRLRKEREGLELSQQALADLLAINKTDVQRFEAGKKSIPAEMLPVIGDALGTHYSKQSRARLLGVARNDAVTTRVA